MTEERDIVARVGAHVREEREAEPDPKAAEPLGDDAVDRIVARVTPKKSAPAKVIAFPRWARTYGAPIAVAAAVVLFIATRDGGEDGPILPGYGITAHGEQAMRGDSQPTTKLRIGKSAASKFEIVLRPETTVGEAKVVAYAFTMENGEPVALDAKVDVSKDGAVRIAGEAKTLRSTNEIRVVLATPESIKGFEKAADRAKSGKGDERVKVLAVAIERE